MLDGALRTDCDATDKLWLLRCRISPADEESGPPGKLLPHCRRKFLGRDPLHFAAEKFFAPPNDFVPSRRIDLGTERFLKLGAEQLALVFGQTQRSSFDLFDGAHRKLTLPQDSDSIDIQKLVRVQQHVAKIDQR